MVPPASATRPATPTLTEVVSRNPLRTWEVSPPTTAAKARTEWLARAPYHGTSSSSRRSIVEMNATHAPAVGPPRTIAAATNGKWNVHTE